MWHTRRILQFHRNEAILRGNKKKSSNRSNKFYEKTLDNKLKHSAAGSQQRERQKVPGMGERKLTICIKQPSSKLLIRADEDEVPFLFHFLCLLSSIVGVSAIEITAFSLALLYHLAHIGLRVLTAIAHTKLGTRSTNDDIKAYLLSFASAFR